MLLQKNTGTLLITIILVNSRVKAPTPPPWTSRGHKPWNYLWPHAPPWGHLCGKIRPRIIDTPWAEDRPGVHLPIPLLQILCPKRCQPLEWQVGCQPWELVEVTLDLCPPAIESDFHPHLMRKVVGCTSRIGVQLMNLRGQLPNPLFQCNVAVQRPLHRLITTLQKVISKEISTCIHKRELRRSWHLIMTIASCSIFQV